MFSLRLASSMSVMQAFHAVSSISLLSRVNNLNVRKILDILHLSLGQLSSYITPCQESMHLLIFAAKFMCDELVFLILMILSIVFQ